MFTKSRSNSGNMLQVAERKSKKRMTYIQKKQKEENSLKINIIGASIQLSDYDDLDKIWDCCMVEEERKEEIDMRVPLKMQRKQI